MEHTTPNPTPQDERPDAEHEQRGLAELLEDLVGHRNVQRALEVFADRDDATLTVLDAALNMIWISRRGAREIVGEDPMQFEGRQARDFIHPDDVEHAERELRRAVAGEAIDYRSRARHPGGDWVPLRNVGWGVDAGTRARVVTVSVLDHEALEADGDDQA